MLSNTLRLNFSYLTIIHIPHPRYHSKIIGHILNNKQKNKRVFINENEDENEKYITQIRQKQTWVQTWTQI